MADTAQEFLDVAVELPLVDTFCYRLPPSLRRRVRQGSLVWVPFGNRQVVGVVLKTQASPPEGQETKDILKLLVEEPIFSSGDLAWYQWASQYYLHPLGKILKTALAPAFRRKAHKRIRLTNAGRDLLRKGAGAIPRELEVLRNTPQGCDYAELARRWGEPRTQGLVEQWKALGWVDVLSYPGGVFLSPRRVQTVRLSHLGERCLQEDHFQGQNLGARQQQILRILAGEGERPVAALEHYIPGARTSITGLVKKGLVTSLSQEVHSSPLALEESGVTAPPHLNPHQMQVLEPLQRTISQDLFQAFLLWGVTGSGKTEIYLRAAEDCVRRGRQVIVLVPEISLTHQLVREFMGRFGERIAVLHSRLSAAERSEMWRAILQRRVSIVLGARSALFAPCRDLGLIIVDEEHDGAYKQEEGFRYHARDMALMRGKLSRVVVLLGSATPSLETFHNARMGKLTCLELPVRVEGRPLPTLEIVDLRHSRAKRGEREVLSPVLQRAMAETLDRGEQVLLFLNRRGYATFLICPQCGYVFRCANCSVTLVYHLSYQALRCHYCGWTRPAPALCPQCHGTEVIDLGIGTETLEQAVRARFPCARILRMDRDTTSRKHARRQILGAWRRGDADILIGTQMVAKGHHVPNVTLVGVILADISLNLPDFRAAEKTFQLLVQVSGRAGRGEGPGRVIVQTYHPDHPSILFSAAQAYSSFAEHELRAREEAGYPPFGHLVLFRISGPGEEQTASAARLVGQIAQKICRQRKEVRCLGPSPAPLARLKGRYRWHLLLKGTSRSALNLVARHLLDVGRIRIPRRIRLSADVDPQSFL